MVPQVSGTSRGRDRLVRRARSVRGRTTFELACHPAFDYGRSRTPTAPWCRSRTKPSSPRSLSRSRRAVHSSTSPARIRSWQCCRSVRRAVAPHRHHRPDRHRRRSHLPDRLTASSQTEQQADAYHLYVRERWCLDSASHGQPRTPSAERADLPKPDSLPRRATRHAASAPATNTLITPNAGHDHQALGGGQPAGTGTAP